jgi:hypothetical protein
MDVGVFSRLVDADESAGCGRGVLDHGVLLQSTNAERNRPICDLLTRRGVALPSVLSG